MSLLVWNDKYSVGIDKLDQQHKHLIDLLNTLHDAMLKGKGKEKMNEIVKELLEYTEYHFKTEEEFLKIHSFSDFSSHKKQHDEFREKVSSFNDKLKSDKAVISSEVLNLLKEWISHHILEVDKKYSNELSTKDRK